jgi:hypothetical protein
MPVRRVFVSALWILTIASLVMLPKFVVSRNQDTQMETCDDCLRFNALCTAMLIAGSAILSAQL